MLGLKLIFSKQVPLPLVNFKIKSRATNKANLLMGLPFKVMALSPSTYTCDFTFSKSAETYIATRCPLYHVKPTRDEFHYQLHKSYLKKSFSKSWILGVSYNSYYNSLLLLIYILFISKVFR